MLLSIILTTKLRAYTHANRNHQYLDMQTQKTRIGNHIQEKAKQCRYHTQLNNSVGNNYSGTSPCGHPSYVDIMLLWTLFLGPIHGVNSMISSTTVDTP